MAPINEPLREMALFAGCGGGILGGILLGWETICAVEINAFCARRLMQRQNEGHLPPFPIWDDVSTWDGRPWRGRVDVVSGGFPCQDISAAGKGAGIGGERSGLWKQMARIIGEVRPRFAFVENSPMLTIRGLGIVLRDLAEMGYDARWGVLAACDAGANHERERIFILASDADDKGQSILALDAEMEASQESHADASRTPREGGELSKRVIAKHAEPDLHPWWKSEPCIRRVDDGMAARMDRIRAIGNGQVPHCVALAWKTLALNISTST